MGIEIRAYRISTRLPTLKESLSSIRAQCLEAKTTRERVRKRALEIKTLGIGGNTFVSGRRDNLKVIQTNLRQILVECSRAFDVLKIEDPEMLAALEGAKIQKPRGIETDLDAY